MPGGISCARWAGGSRALYDYGSRAIDIPGHRCRCGIYHDLLLCGENLNAHYFRARSGGGIRWPACTRRSEPRHSAKRGHGSAGGKWLRKEHALAPNSWSGAAEVGKYFDQRNRYYSLLARGLDEGPTLYRGGLSKRGFIQFAIS